MEPRRAQVTIGAIHSGTGIGIAGGLLLGGLAGAGDASWRTFFVVGAVASAIGIVCTLAAVRDSPERAEGRVDLIGAALLSSGLIGLLLAFSEGPTWGWGSASTLLVGLAGLGLLGAWWRSQSAIADPLISARQLLRPEVRIPYAITFLVAFGVYGALTALSRLAQMPTGTGFGYGYSTLQVAWYAVPQALGSIACLVVIRRLVPRGHRASALAWGAGSIILAFLVFGLLIRSPGATMAGLSIVLYAVGNTTGSAVVGVLFKSLTIGHTPLPSVAAFRWGFAISGVAAVLALGLCAALARRSDRVPAAHPVAT